MHWISTRKLHVFTFFIIVSIAASFFFVEAYVANPYLPKINYNQKVVPEELGGTKNFEIPDISHIGQNTIVSVICNVTSSNNFVEGTPVAIDVFVSLPQGVYNYYGVRIMPSDAYSILTPSLYGSAIYCTSQANSSSVQVWGGFEVVEFYSSGPIILNVDIRLLPLPEFNNNSYYAGQFLSEFPNSDYNQNLILDYATIQSKESVQQQQNNSLTLSLTYFVLFFASADIAVALYDHSEDKDKKSEYDKIQAYKEGLKEAERDYKTV